MRAIGGIAPCAFLSGPGRLQFTRARGRRETEWVNYTTSFINPPYTTHPTPHRDRRDISPGAARTALRRQNAATPLLAARAVYPTTTHAPCQGPSYPPVGPSGTLLCHAGQHCTPPRPLRGRRPVGPVRRNDHRTTRRQKDMQG